MKRRFFLPAFPLPFSFLLPLLLASFLPSVPAFGNLVPERLRVEYLENPLGLDASVPRLSWVVTSKARGQRQAAYRILAAASASRTGVGMTATRTLSSRR